MKHLKIYEKFEYPQATKDQMKHFGWYNEEKIGYVVSTTDERNPERKTTYTKLKDAIDFLERENSEEWYTKLCIYETRVRVVSEEEINLELEKEKYNL